jgi:Na+-transporting methylmalonyl-CoA/oxaloacetate decarboxylase gamma subunit
MLRIPDIRRLHRLSVLAALSFLAFATQAFSQSGRRSKPPVSAPPPTIEESKPVNSNTRELSEQVTLVVGREFTSRRMMSEETILANFVNRLNEFKNVNATTIGDFNRDRARKRAKQETETIVLLLQFDIDSFQKGTYILNSPDLDVRVLAFGPGTGQEKFKGKVYYKAQDGPMVKRDNWPGGTPIKITAEAVGVEAAEQVHDWLLIEALRKKQP